MLEDIKKALDDIERELNDIKRELVEKRIGEREWIELSYTRTPDNEHNVKFEINIKNLDWVYFVDDLIIAKGRIIADDVTRIEIIDIMLKCLENSKGKLNYDDFLKALSKTLSKEKISKLWLKID